MAEVHPTAIVYPGTVLGEGVRVLEHAVVGKQPTLSPRSTAKREALPPTEIGAGTVVSTGAVVFAGSRIGARVILGDQSCVRERVTVGDEKMAVFDDMELERKVTVYEKAPWKRTDSYGEWQTRSGDIWIPKIPTDEPLKLECQEFLRLVGGEGDRRKVAEDGARVVRALDALTESLDG